MITTPTGLTYESAASPGECTELLLGADGEPLVRRGAVLRCERPTTRYTVRPGLGRPACSACYCERHGGAARALDELGREWMLAAPESVGGLGAVLDAGAQGLTTREAYVIVRPEHGRWLAWLGLGGHLLQVSDPGSPGQLTRAGKPRMRWRRGQLVPRSTRAFASREAALDEAVRAWRANLDEAIARITAARGGTLAWGVPVEPLSEPVVIELGEHGSAWEVAVTLPRRGRQGLAAVSGLRPSGEAA